MDTPKFVEDDKGRILHEVSWGFLWSKCHPQSTLGTENWRTGQENIKLIIQLTFLDLAKYLRSKVLDVLGLFHLVTDCQILRGSCSQLCILQCHTKLSIRARDRIQEAPPWEKSALMISYCISQTHRNSEPPSVDISKSFQGSPETLPTWSPDLVVGSEAGDVHQATSSYQLFALPGPKVQKKTNSLNLKHLVAWCSQASTRCATAETKAGIAPVPRSNKYLCDVDDFCLHIAELQTRESVESVEFKRRMEMMESARSSEGLEPKSQRTLFQHIFQLIPAASRPPGLCRRLRYSSHPCQTC